MKALKIVILVMSCCMFSLATAQQNQFSLYVGGQVPTEVAFLDFGGNGVADVFKPGISLGVSVERNWKILGLRSDLDFGMNGMKNDLGGSTTTTYDGPLYSLYSRNFVQFTMLRKKEVSMLAIGVGIGAIVANTPKTTFKYDFITDDGQDQFVLERRAEYSGSLCSTIRLNLPISNRFSFYGSFNNDLIIYLGDVESVVYTSLNLGVSFML